MVTLLTVTGEIEIDGVHVSVASSGRSDSLIVDGSYAFNKSSLTINLDGEQQIAILDAEQVELFLKLIGVVPYGGTNGD